MKNLVDLFILFAILVTLADLSTGQGGFVPPFTDACIYTVEADCADSCECLLCYNNGTFVSCAPHDGSCPSGLSTVASLDSAHCQESDNEKLYGFLIFIGCMLTCAICGYVILHSGPYVARIKNCFRRNKYEEI